MVGMAAALADAKLRGKWTFSLCFLHEGLTSGETDGMNMLQRWIRKLAIGLGAAAVTYVLGLAFGATIG